MGLGMAVFPELKIIHLMPKERVSEDYLVRLHEGIMISHWLLEYKWRGKRPSSPSSPRNLIAALKNVLVLSGVKRRMYLADVRARAKALRMIEALEGRGA
jgi:hypothetical protein